MNLNESLCYLSNQFNGKISQFDERDFGALKKCFQMMEQDVKHIESTDNSLDLSKDNTEKVKLVNESLFVLIRLFLNGVLTPGVINFVAIFSQFIFNWNQNTMKLESIDLLARFVYQHVASVEQIKSTIRVLKKTVGAYQDLKNWMPPAFDISKAYFDELISKKFKAG